MFLMWIYLAWKESTSVKKNFYKEPFCLMIEEIYIDIGINLNNLNGNLLLLDILASNFFLAFYYANLHCIYFFWVFFPQLTLSETLQFFTTCKILQYDSKCCTYWKVLENWKKNPVDHDQLHVCLNTTVIYFGWISWCEHIIV